MGMLALAVIVLPSCSDSYSRSDIGGTEKAAVHLDSKRGVLVAIPKDGNYEGRQYPGSGDAVALRTAASFSKHAPRVDLASPTLHERDELINEAQKRSAGYIAIPTIAHWEPRATAWSGLPSRATIGLEIVDVDTGQDVTSTLLESRSRIMTLTGTSPGSLLPRLIGDYVDGLY
jgi:hypothetical protein